MQTFYNGLFNPIKTTIDAAIGGVLMAKFIDDVYDLLEKMVTNNYQWHLERSLPRKVAGVLELDVINDLAAQVATLTKKFEIVNV